MKIVTTADTFFKALPVDPSQLTKRNHPDQLIKIQSGTCFEIDSEMPFQMDDGITDDHVLVQLKQPLQGHRGIRWFVGAGAARIEGTEPGNDPKDEPAPDPPLLRVNDYGPTIQIPGISRPVGIYEPVYFEPAPCNFTWSEMTKGGARIPVSATITYRIVKLCRYMDAVRAHLGDRPIKVTSGYRDPKTNRRVNGARSSRHMAGDAVDFYVEGMSVVDTFYKLKDYHRTGGLAVGNGFVHLDLRPGAPARWSYPNGPKVSLW
ncbi:MAG: D-Ala-D-Ala carboxypeptidase family metallohydrolase [Cyanobacteria bacterium J06614_10]